MSKVDQDIGAAPGTAGTSLSLRRVLIANRGEIAIRIARAAAALGIESVGVYTAADRHALHTRFTTTAVEIGTSQGTKPAAADNPANPVAAHLDIDTLLAAAADTGCDSVHPGYGFLAESGELARRCETAGLTLIGSSSSVLDLFGEKVQARALATSLDVPVVPGSGEAAKDEAAAAAVAADVGYPVMLKASAGGGGRGMRAVASPTELSDAFGQCRREAEAAFGDGALFVERLIELPRHIEVQVLADTAGNVVHLHDRDCSVQHRNQKLIEIAPAPALDDDLRSRILADALRLVGASGLVNAATIEFLVVPERGEHFFIECNPRIQVEHTVTEQVTGIDLVEAQFRLAAGASLAELGLTDQAAVGSPRGFAVQARVSATGNGMLTAYKEPSGPGIRVDAAGYPGWSPPPQFDPLLAKVIATAPMLDAAVDRADRALGEFHLVGVATNLDQLRAILARPEVRSGDARTTLLAEMAEMAKSSEVDGHGDPGESSLLALLDEQAPGLNGHGPGSGSGSEAPVVGLDVADTDVAVTSPSQASVVEVRTQPGQQVAAGDTVLVVSAMKMETLVTAPCDGVVAAVAELASGDMVATGQVVAAVTPGVIDGPPQNDNEADGTKGSWQPTLDQIATLQALAEQRLAPGSTEPGVVRQRDRGKLTCRERIALLLDEGSFREIGSVAGFASYDADGEIVAFTPANHVGGTGAIEARQVVVCADDFTSRGGHADGAIGAKSLYLDRLSTELRVPSVRMLDGSSGGGSVAAMVPRQQSAGESTAKESSGAIESGRPRVAGGGGSFLPPHLGSTPYTRQLSTVPVVNLLLGSVVGIGAAKAVLGHFSVMVRDIAQLFVAGPPVVSHAMGYDVTKEELGGWHIHCRNGAVDNLAETEEDAAAQTCRFLSYLPSNVWEAPPVIAPPAGERPDRRDDELLGLVPRKRTTTFDVRRVIELLADTGSFFEIGPLWGTDQVVGLARFDGYPVGVIASDSRHPNGGALTADGCDKLTRHLDLCDLFHLPVLNLIDNPGFAVGIEHEVAATIRRGGEWMVAFAQVQMPIFTVVMRRSFGVAGNNYATPRAQPSMRVTWPSADAGGIPPEGGIEAAYKRQLAEAADPAALRAELNARIEKARGPLGPLSRFELEEMIDPRDTRRLVCEWAPTAHRLATAPDRLGPRSLQFRP